MKKLFILITLFAFLSLSCGAQSIFRPVDKSIFTQTVDKGLKVSQNASVASVWLWRLNATLIADELIYNKTTKQFDSAPLSAMGPGIGYRHYYQDALGNPATDWGINFCALLGTDIEHITPASIKAALTINAFQFVNVGVDYSFGGKTFGLLLGASVNF